MQFVYKTESSAPAERGRPAQPVYRESVRKGAVLTRVAASRIRVGTFEFLAGRRDHASLRALADYAIHRHNADLADTPRKYLRVPKSSHRSASFTHRAMATRWIHSRG